MILALLRVLHQTSLGASGTSSGASLGGLLGPLWELSGAPLVSSLLLWGLSGILSKDLWCELCGAERSEAPRSGSGGGWFHPREVK